MSDKLKIEKMQLQLELKEEEASKGNVLSDLLVWINELTGNLYNEVYVLEEERDIDFLKGILIELGYEEAIYERNYNSHHNCYLYTITNLIRS